MAPAQSYVGCETRKSRLQGNESKTRVARFLYLPIIQSSPATFRFSSAKTSLYSSCICAVSPPINSKQRTAVMRRAILLVTLFVATAPVHAGQKIAVNDLIAELKKSDAEKLK